MNSAQIKSDNQSGQAKRLALFAVLFLLQGTLHFNLHAAATNSVARVWDERALAAIRADTPHPPAQARNYFSLSVCMWDAWAAYDPTADGYVYRGIFSSQRLRADRTKWISYAALRMLKDPPG